MHVRMYVVTYIRMNSIVHLNRIVVDSSDMAYVRMYIVHLDLMVYAHTHCTSGTYVCMHCAVQVGYACHSQMHFDLNAGQSEHAREGRRDGRSVRAHISHPYCGYCTYMHTQK